MLNLLKVLLAAAVIAPLTAAEPAAKDRQATPRPPHIAEVLRFGAPGGVYLEREPLRFLIKPAFLPASLHLSDWRGRPVAVWTASDGDWIAPRLPTGYYLLEFKSADGKFTGKTTFTVLADPADPRPAAMPYAFDTAQSWLARAKPNNVVHPADGFETVSELCRRSGVTMIRERLAWRDVQLPDGTFNWGNYRRNADLLHERGVQISGMFHDSPAFTRQQSPKLPDDLLALRNFTCRLAQEFRGQMTTWEFWNEPDIHFSPEAAWDYAAVLKAAYLGFKKGDPALPIQLGGIAMTPFKPYVGVLMANDVTSYFDIFSFHTYRPLRDYPAAAAEIQALRVRHHFTGKPVWLSENGCLAEGTGRLDSIVPGEKAQSPEQELLAAEYLVKSQLLMQSLGVDRTFSFVLPPFNERNGSKDFGMMRRDYSTKISYAALAVLIRELGAAEYLGEVEAGQGVRAFLFRQPDGGFSLAFWSASELESKSIPAGLTPEKAFAREFRLPLAPGAYRLADLAGMNTELTAQADGIALTATRFPAYLSGIRQPLPFQPTRVIRRAPDAVPDFDREVVFKVVRSDDFMLSPEKDSVDVVRSPGRLTLQIWNFSDQPRRGRVIITGGAVTGLPETVEIAPNAVCELPIAFAPAVAAGGYAGVMTVAGEFDRGPVGRLIMPTREYTRLAESAHAVELEAAADPAHWKENTSGRLTVTRDAAEQAVRFETVFPPNIDRWSYPVYALQLPRESLRGAVAIEFEVKAGPGDQEHFTQMILMAGLDAPPGKTIRLNCHLPSDRWQRQIIPLDAIPDPGKVVMLRLGVNAKADRIVWLVRNLKVLYGKTPEAAK